MNDYETDYETDEMESLSELVAGLESDELDELAERRRRRRERGVRTASTGTSLPTATSSGVYVKKSEFARYAMTVDKKNEINTKAITTLNARANTLADQQAIQARAIKKQRRDLMTAVTKQQNTLVLYAAADLFLKTTRDVASPITGTTVEKGDKLVVQKADATFTPFVPLVIALFGGQLSGLLGGLGSGGASSGSSGSSGP